MNEQKKKLKRSIPFVKYYLELSYLFSPEECRFIMHMTDIEFLKKSGYQTGWSKKEYIKRMGLSEYSFDKSVERLQKMGLLSRTHNSLGNKVFYSFDMDLYNRLVEILSMTCDIDKLIAFCNINFVEQSRSIESITEQEINDLETHNKKKKIHPSALHSF
jgi:hypothetical protein